MLYRIQFNTIMHTVTELTKLSIIVLAVLLLLHGR